MPNNFADENILLQELKHRNPEAYEFLYNSSRKYLYVLAFSILGKEEAAKDLLQDFFTDFWELRLYENINKSLHSYLYFAVRNRAFNYRKKDLSYQILINELAITEKTHIPRYLENDELKNQIELVINSLPPMASKTFKMHYLQNKTHVEIAEALGISKQTVGNHIHRALVALRQALVKII